MGLQTVEALLEHGAQVWAVNRGTPYWVDKRTDKSEFEKLMAAYPHDLTHVKANRRKRESFIKTLRGLETSWDAIVDFSCLLPSDMKTMVEADLDTKLYTYISTDSVYDVT